MTQTRTDFHESASKLSFETRLFIDGKFKDAQSGKASRQSTRRPARLLGRVAEGDAADIDLAVAAARRAFDKGSWSNLAPRERKKVLLRFANLIEKNLTELAVMETLDSGKPISDSLARRLPFPSSRTHQAAGLPPSPGHVSPSRKPFGNGSDGSSTY
jgi:gamma-glutamyl-gamma-aminobutyraldehyde dehydrogenase